MMAQTVDFLGGIAKRAGRLRLLFRCRFHVNVQSGEIDADGRASGAVIEALFQVIVEPDFDAAVPTFLPSLTP